MAKKSKAKKPSGRLFDDWDGEPLPPHVIESLNRQMQDIENQPRYDPEQVIQEIERKLQEFEDAQGRDSPPGTRAVA